MDVEEMTFEPSGWVPNNPSLPVLLYRLPLGGVDLKDGFEALFARHGWTGIWANGVFDYQHYHAGAHEVLGIARGTATLLIGGPDGRQLQVAAGHCLLLPAGTGHQNLGSSPDFLVIGAYPPNQHADIQTSAASKDMLSKITSVALPLTDPVQGISGALIERWRLSENGTVGSRSR